MTNPLTPAAIATATTAIGGEVAKSVLDDVSAKIDQIVENATIRFSNLGQDLIAQLKNSVDELWKQIDRDINELVSNLTDTLKVQLYNLKLAVEKILNEAIEDINQVTDDFVRDIRQTISRTWFMSEIYALDVIDGTLIPSNINSDWIISATGLNLGFDSEDIKSVVNLRIKIPNSNDYIVLGAEVSAYTVEFVVSANLIEELRKDQSITFLNASLETKIIKDRDLWFDKKFNGIQKFKITLAPRISGNIFSRCSVPQKEWVKNSAYDIVYSNSLPSGHATSSSKVGHHRITRRYSLPQSSVPPRIGDRRFYKGENAGCFGGGCSHLHECRIRVINNGSTLDVYTYNNSHAITVSIRGYVERYEKVAENNLDNSPVPIISSDIIFITFPVGFEVATIEGRDLDFGLINLVVKRDINTNVYPMPEGIMGSLIYLGNHIDKDKVIYRFIRK